jgi:hypothetical protein
LIFIDDTEVIILVYVVEKERNKEQFDMVKRNKSIHNTGIDTNYRLIDIKKVGYRINTEGSEKMGELNRFTIRNVSNILIEK